MPGPTTPSLLGRADRPTLGPQLRLFPRLPLFKGTRPGIMAEGDGFNRILVNSPRLDLERGIENGTSRTPYVDGAQQGFGPQGMRLGLAVDPRVWHQTRSIETRRVDRARRRHLL